MELRPFRSIRFSPKVLKARGLSAVFAPPYDQIGPAKRDALYAQAPENIVRIVSRKPDGEDVYAGAAKTQADWLADGTLEKERRPALWIYRQTFTDGGQTFVRDALVGLVKLAEYESGVVRPHERTLAKPKADRLALLAATKADLELVFLMTRAPLSAALSTRRVAQLTATDPDGVRHDAFRISDYAAHVELQGLVKNAESIIADGHHRYETALAFSKDPAAAKLPGARYKLCAIVDMASPGLVVRPIHRLIAGVPNWDPDKLLASARAYFDVEEQASAQDAVAALQRHSRIRPAFVLYAPPARPVLLTLKADPAPLPWPEGRSEAWKGLDVAALEVVLFQKLLSIDTDAIARGEHVSFTSDTAAALAAVEKKESQAAVLMRPTTVADVEAVVSAGDRLPQKSTHFFPKMYSGIFGVSLEEPVSDVTAEELAASAQALLAGGDRSGAIAACRQALAVDPDCLAAHVCMARAKLPGDDYLVWLARFHAELAPATYLEIGVDAGRTLSLARPPTVAIGVDPALSATQPPFAATTRTFAMESDAFFASPEAGARLGPTPVALAFVDGLHLFEQALRDFLHVERHAARGSVVLFHDCLPLDRATSARERRTGFWSGDVWKLLPILREHRPDLDAFVIPAYPTGLGVVTRLDPSSTRLDGRRLEEITRSWVPREWNDAPGEAPALPLVENDGPAVLARIRGAAASGG